MQALTLAAAITRPRGLPEAAVAVPAATLCVLFGPIPAGDAWTEARALGPTLAFLAAVLVLAQLCAAGGLFRWAGAALATAARGRPIALLAWVTGLGTVVTTVLSLDAPVVLFTPVLLAAAARAGVRARPHLHVTVHLANSASLLLPVSNVTNLLAFAAAGLSFGRFAALMLAPLPAVLAVEYAGARLLFARDPRDPAHPIAVAATDSPRERVSPTRCPTRGRATPCARLSAPARVRIDVVLSHRLLPVARSRPPPTPGSPSAWTRPPPWCGC